MPPLRTRPPVGVPLHAPAGPADWFMIRGFSHLWEDFATAAPAEPEHGVPKALVGLNERRFRSFPPAPLALDCPPGKSADHFEVGKEADLGVEGCLVADVAGVVEDAAQGRTGEGGVDSRQTGALSVVHLLGHGVAIARLDPCAPGLVDPCTGECQRWKQEDEHRDQRPHGATSPGVLASTSKPPTTVLPMASAALFAPPSTLAPGASLMLELPRRTPP